MHRLHDFIVGMILLHVRWTIVVFVKRQHADGAICYLSFSLCPSVRPSLCLSVRLCIARERMHISSDIFGQGKHRGHFPADRTYVPAVWRGPTKFCRVIRVWRGMFLGDKPRPHPKGASVSPTVLAPPSYAHMVRHTGTKLDMMIKQENFYKIDHAACPSEKNCDTNVDALCLLHFSLHAWGPTEIRGGYRTFCSSWIHKLIL